MADKFVTVGGNNAAISGSKMLHGQVATHSYGTGHVDWTLSGEEMGSGILIATGTADSGCNAIATPTSGALYIVVNTCGQTLTFKATGQSGVAIASTKTAIVRGNGTDFARVTADAS